MDRIETGYKKFLTHKEAACLREWIRTRPDNYKWVYYLLFLGLRIGEAVALKTTDIHEDKIMYVVEKSKGKFMKSRVLPKKLGKWLRRYIKNHHRDFRGNYLAYAIHGNHYDHLQTSSIRADFLKFRRKYKLEETYYTCRDGKKLFRISPHTCRHYFLTAVYEKTKDLFLTAELIGHKNPETTMEYIRAWNVEKREREITEKVFKI